MSSDYSIKKIKQEFKDKGVFYTPPELALFLKELMPEDVKEVYDPTCGRGNLLSVFDDDVKKYGQDIDDVAVEEAKELVNDFIGRSGDVLKEDKFKYKQFDCVVANPPFSIKWEQNKDDERFSVAPALAPKSKADYAFILHIISKLTDDGVAAVLNFPGILYRRNAEGKIRKWLIEQNYIDKVILIPGDKFTDTSIQTVVLVLKKKRSKTSIHFINQVDDVEREVEVEEIKENDYSLTVNYYAKKEVEKEIIDPYALEKSVRKAVVDKLKNQMNMSMAIYFNFERNNPKFPSIESFIFQIRRVVDDMEREYIERLTYE